MPVGNQNLQEKIQTSQGVKSIDIAQNFSAPDGVNIIEDEGFVKAVNSTNPALDMEFSITHLQDARYLYEALITRTKKQEDEPGDIDSLYITPQEARALNISPEDNDSFAEMGTTLALRFQTYNPDLASKSISIMQDIFPEIYELRQKRINS